MENKKIELENQESLNQLLSSKDDANVILGLNLLLNQLSLVDSVKYCFEGNLKFLSCQYSIHQPYLYFNYFSRINNKTLVLQNINNEFYAKIVDYDKPDSVVLIKSYTVNKFKTSEDFYNSIEVDTEYTKELFIKILLGWDTQDIS